MGDFTGFTFNGIHSSEFNILRVSNGNRYQDVLIPDFSIESGDIPGGDGEYYFGSNFKRRTFETDIAYDNISEIGKRRIKKWLHPDDNLHELIFDERPYVKYFARLNKLLTVKELCFDTEKGRIYRGDGTIEFVIFFPFGVQVNKDLDYFNEYENINEWAESSRLLSHNELATPIDNFYNIDGARKAKIYNCGDKSANYKLTFRKTGFYNTLTRVGNIKLENAVPYYVKKISGSIATNQTYYIYFNDSWYDVSYTNNAWKAGEGEENSFEGYFDGVTFISNNDGSVYDTYEQNTSTNFVEYSFNKNFGITEGKYIVLIGESFNTYNEIEVISVDNINKKVVIYFVNGSANPLKLYLPFVGPVVYNFEYLNDTFSITFPSCVLTIPSYWSEAQKATFYPCEIIIDTSKQTISYKRTDISTQDKIGLMDVLKGNLFKLPIDEQIPEEFNIYEISCSINLYMSYLSNFNIEYNYYYI